MIGGWWRRREKEGGIEKERKGGNGWRGVWREEERMGVKVGCVRRCGGIY